MKGREGERERRENRVGKTREGKERKGRQGKGKATDKQTEERVVKFLKVCCIV